MQFDVDIVVAVAVVVDADNDADADIDVEFDADDGDDGTGIDVGADDAYANVSWRNRAILRTRVDVPAVVVAYRTNLEVDSHLVTAFYIDGPLFFVLLYYHLHCKRYLHCRCSETRLICFYLNLNLNWNNRA